ncbi:MAG: Cytosine deaminase [Proteobacteria bacterium]|nr:Cytosine deaminase [Pseudomonadota bacterium]
MSADFVALPDVSRFALINATLPTALLSKPLAGPVREGLIPAHVIIDAGRIAAILPTETTLPYDIPRVDLDGGLVWPCFTPTGRPTTWRHAWISRCAPPTPTARS